MTIKHSIYFNLLCLIISSQPLFSQSINMINNGGFESGTSLPYQEAQADLLYHWRSQTYSPNNSFPYYHSPDWYHFGFGVVTPPHSGYGQLGIGNYEMIEQPVSFADNEYYKLDFYIAKHEHGASQFNIGSSLKVYIAKNEILYKNVEDQCIDNYVTYWDSPIQDIINIATFDLTSTSIPFEEYIKYSITFKTPSNGSSYDFIGFDLRINNWTPGLLISECQDAYILLDDVFLSPICLNQCTYYPPIIHSPITSPLGVTGNNDPLQFIFENAMYFSFDLIDEDTQGSYFNYECYDPNGLKNPGYNNFLFLWDGILNGGITQTFLRSFVYHIRLWSCTSGWVNLLDNVLVFHPASNGAPAYSIPEFHNYILDDCCPEDAIINNYIYPSGFSRTDVSDLIAAGHTGPVILPPTASLKYHAGNAINIGGYFDAQIGSEYEAEVVPCGTLRTSNNVQERPKFVQNTFQGSKNTTNEFQIYPNPNKGKFFISSENNNYSKLIKKIEIIDLNGRLMHTELINNPVISANIEIDKKVVPGIYICKVISDFDVQNLSLEIIE